MKLRRTMKAQSPKKKEKERNNSNNNKRRGPRLSQGKGCATRILEGNAQAKLLGLEFQIPQVLCKSTKSVRIEAKILVVDSFL